MGTLKQLETFGAKFVSVDKKQAYKFPPTLIKRMIELYIAYNSHSPGNEVHRTIEPDDKTDKKLNW